jgi:uncharacterized protein
MTRVVIDANVLASAAAGHPNSPSGRLLLAFTEGAVEAVVCERTLAELERALQRPYFAARVIDAGRRAFIEMLRAATDVRSDPVTGQSVLRDPADDYLVALARDAGAEAIVSGDKDLLEHPGLVPPAMTPREACERFDLP